MGVGIGTVIVGLVIVTSTQTTNAEAQLGRSGMELIEVLVFSRAHSCPNSFYSGSIYLFFSFYRYPGKKRTQQF